MLRLKGWLGIGVVFVIYMYLRYVKWGVLLFHDDSETVSKAYIITQSYGGQLTRAIRNMMVQQCWAGILREDVIITEPFSVKSQLVHEPQIWNDLETGQLHYAARFGDYYNLSYYNAQSIKHGSAPLITWENFLTSAPHMAVAVSMPARSCSGIMVATECSFSKSYKTFVNVLIDMGFNVMKKICLICSALNQPFKLEDFSKLLFSVGSNNISIIMDSWRNYGFTSSWIEIPDYCKLVEKPQLSNSFLVPSDLVMHHSSRYIDRFIQNKHYVGVMLRIERFLTTVSSGRSNDSVWSCLNKTITLIDEIMSRDLGVYVTVDIGKYGSGVMQNKVAVSHFKETITDITKIVELLLTHLYNTTVTLETWEDTFLNATGGISERGYIAMVQRNIANQADCLILMGGGSFQQVAGFQYLENMKDKNIKPCLHTICVLESFNKKLFDTIS